MTVELDRDDLVNLINNLILLYTNDIRKKVIDSYIEDGEDEEMAQFIVDYFEYIYGKRGEEE